MTIKELLPQKFFRNEDKKGKNYPSEYYKPFYRMQREIEDIFSDFYDRSFFKGVDERFSPKSDVIETDSHYVIKSELPGMEEKDITIEVKDNMLNISGKKEYKKENEDAKIHRLESYYGSFEKTIQLPDNIDEEKIKARLKNGILEIDIEKVPASKESAKVIEISKE